jgi:hypothetical protein
MCSIESKQDDNDTQGRVSVRLWTVIECGRKRPDAMFLPSTFVLPRAPSAVQSAR